MQMLATSKNLTTRRWARGIVGAFISGGAASVASGSAASFMDKQHDLNIPALMGLTFVISGVISIAKFLENEPLPPEPSTPSTPPAA